MTLSMFQASVPVFRQMLGALDILLIRGEAHAAERKIDPAVLLGWRLAPDMFNLTRQVQVACDMAKGCVARLAGDEVPKWEDTETSFAELRARVAKTIGYVSSFSPERIDGTEERGIELTLGGKPARFKGQAYLVGFVLPNFYFHVTTAYDLLRMAGVTLGKRDYLGQFEVGR